MTGKRWRNNHGRRKARRLNNKSVAKQDSMRPYRRGWGNVKVK